MYLGCQLIFSNSGNSCTLRWYYLISILGVNVCKVNQDHHLFTCGTTEGQVEAWDPRSRQRSSTLDCALALLKGDHLENNDQIPQVTSLAFRDGLNMAVGTSTGHILLYDIRSSRPLLVKDHLYGTPIKSLLFHSTLDQVISLGMTPCC